MAKDLEVLTSEREDAAPASRLGTILIVEDDPRMQKVLQRLFTGEHYSVITAEMGSRLAWHCFALHRPLAVILDLIFA